MLVYQWSPHDLHDYDGVNESVLVDLDYGGKARNLPTVEAEALTGGDVEAGCVAVRTYGCNACHTIPGVVDARWLVGPPLMQIANRIDIAGVLTNTPDNLIAWIQNPPRVDPRTAMPNLGIDETDARDIAAYLYTLR